MPSSVAHEARPLHAIPSALDCMSDVAEAIRNDTLQLFLDFDGTLARIVPDPDTASIEPCIQRTLEELVGRTPVAILSGRDRSDVERRVGLRGVVFAGSHGLDIRGPGIAHQVGVEARPALDRARERLRSLGSAFPGVQLEAKTLGLAVHYRRIGDASVGDLDARVAKVAHDEPTLRMIRGKKVFELRPDVNWDKGKALMWLRDRLTEDDLAGVPMYLGDDVTDEDAFEALGPEGLSVLVRGEDDSRMSLARFALADPGEVSLFLEELLGLMGPPAA